MKVYKVLLFYLLCGIGFISCINFNPDKKERNQQTESVDIQVNKHDDVAMARSTHLKFKGVPIDGTLEMFMGRMKHSGFEIEESDEGVAVLSGDFADFKECSVYVETLDRKDLVYRISVQFPSQDQWGLLYGDYKHLKNLLIEKYGKPSSCVEKFQGNSSRMPKDDYDKMHDVKFDRCEYETRFTVKNGEIVLWIQHAESILGEKCFVMLSYIDKENSETIRKHALDDL